MFYVLSCILVYFIYRMVNYLNEEIKVYILHFLAVGVTLIVWTLIIIKKEPPSFWVIDTENDWISFWGSFLGGLLSGLATLIVIMITVDHNKKMQTNIIHENNKMNEANRKHNEEINNINRQYNIQVNRELMRSNHDNLIESQLQTLQLFKEDTIRKSMPNLSAANVGKDSIYNYRIGIFEGNDEEFSGIDYCFELENCGFGPALNLRVESKYYTTMLYEYDKDKYFRPVLSLKPNKPIIVAFSNETMSSIEEKAFSLEYDDVFCNMWVQEMRFSSTSNSDTQMIIDKPVLKHDHFIYGKKDK